MDDFFPVFRQKVFHRGHTIGNESDLCKCPTERGQARKDDRLDSQFEPWPRWTRSTSPGLGGIHLSGPPPFS